MPPRKTQNKGFTGYIAAGDIQHGQHGVDYEDVGGAEWYREGDPIPNGVFTDDEIQALLDVRAIVHRDEVGGGMLDSEIAAARKELEDLTRAAEEREKALDEREERLAAEEKDKSAAPASP